MVHPRKKKKLQIKQLAEQHIINYFKLANDIYKDNMDQAHQLIKDAIKISTRTKTPIPKPYKRQYCRHCKHFLVPSINVRIRLHNKKMIYLCQDCKHLKRIPIKRK